jgi:DNA (cytosine-5)-methyltransferase 1
MPTMAEVLAAPRTGLRMVSTFSGCGGACLGYRLAGFDVVWANEFVEAARATYAANFETTPDPRDIRTVTAEDVLAATGLRVGDLDLLEGSPPCASFSMSGKRDAGWGKVSAYSSTKQRTDDLFDEWVRLVDGLRPRAIAAENVMGLTRGAPARGYLRAIARRLDGLGYVVHAVPVLASRSGVAQLRPRLFLLGVRRDVAEAPPVPRPCPESWVLRDVLPVDGPVEEEARAVKPSLRAAWERMGLRNGPTRYFNQSRPSWASPCPTITQTSSFAAGVMHPDECRMFSLAELRALMGFPADFRLPGTYREGYERLGRAVAPPVAYRVGTSVARMLGVAPVAWPAFAPLSEVSP